ncbi:MAG: acetate uptake transporter [Acetobacter sp.]|nr:acetate uptake transporter [Acetobacter sp.]
MKQLPPPPIPIISIRRANPSPMGLMTYGLPTFLLSLWNAGLLPLGSAVLAIGFVFAGITQIIAGLLEWPTGNTFGMTAFVSYGAFWITLVMLIGFPHPDIVPATSPAMMGTYFAIWGSFTAIMFICTLNMPKAYQVLFSSLLILFFLLAFAQFTGSKVLTHIAGWEGLFSASSGIYLGAAELLEAHFGHAIFPVGKPNS